MMTWMKQSLFAALLCTLCAATWLINCVLDVSMCISGSLGRDALLTLAWTTGAVCWWLRWYLERRHAAND